MTFIDSFSYYMRVKPIRSKNKALKTLMKWITQFEVKTGERANILRTDGGSEYMELEFQE